jgi:IS30 family transposase
MHHSKESITKISQVLGRNKGTISRELSRNGVGIGYSANGYKSMIDFTFSYSTLVIDKYHVIQDATVKYKKIKSRIHKAMSETVIPATQ